jgi:biopolymer transport protein ExbB/TolQ
LFVNINFLYCKISFQSQKNIEISKKLLKHVSDSGTLGLALGVMGSFIGLITAFDALEATGAAEPSILAGGLKVALLSTLFGLFTYSISKLSILILRIIQK